MSTPTTPLAETVDHRTAPVAVESKALSVTSLVLGLASLAFGYTFLVPIAAVVLGAMALRREPSSRAMSIWGIVLGSLTLFGGALAVLLGITLLVPAGLAALFAL